MYCLICGDTVPNGINEELFINQRLDCLLDTTLIDLFNNAAFRIINLETPLVDKATPINKCGPNLGVSTKTIRTLKLMGIDLVSIANNHIMDHGIDGLSSTIRVLDENTIEHIGAGTTLQEARSHYTFYLGKKKIGVYACAEEEFSIATESDPGANPVDIFNCLSDIKKIKENHDFVVVLYHGGKEFYRYPSPNQIKRCHSLIDFGANIVLCQHSHCIGCVESYNSGKILYGQGNFIFDGIQNDLWSNGLIVSIDENLVINYIPVIQNNTGIRVANTAEKQRILDEFKSRSMEIQDNNSILNHYLRLSEDKIYDYLAALNGYDNRKFINRVLFRLTKGKYKKWVLDKRYNKRKLLAIKNFIINESHSELMICGLNYLINERSREDK